MSFRVGQSLKIGRDKRATISRIIRDENNYVYFKTMVYIIYIKMDDGSERLFRFIEDMPGVDVVCESEDI